MAADDAAVTVTLRANLKDYEAALKTAVRQTERAAKAAEDAVSNVGRRTPAGQGVAANFQKSSQQIANDARMLQFQLNDIFSGIASGQGVRALQMQLGQIAQQLGGGGLAAGARTLGTALVGMINPINLAVVAFGLLASVAASYFEESTQGAEDLDKALKSNLDVINRLREARGFDPVKRGKDSLDLLIAQRDAINAEVNASKQLKVQLEAIATELNKFKIARRLIATAEEIQGIKELEAALAELQRGLQSGNPDFEKFAATVTRLDVIGTLPDNMKELVAAIIDLSLKGAQAARDLKDLQASLTDVTKSLKILDEVFAGSFGQTILAAIQATIDKVGGLNEALYQIKNTLGGLGDFVTTTWNEVGKSISSAADMIKQEEGFRAGAYWDVNAFRVGFGSDTYVDAMGKVQKVTKDTVVTLDQANQDLNRRIGEFQSTIVGQIGPDIWRSLEEQQQAALTSIAYNYGSLPKSIVQAIKAGDRGQVAEAIANLSANPDRRRREARLFAGSGEAANEPLKRIETAETALKNLADWNVETERRIELEKQVAEINAQVWESEAQRAAQIEALRIAEEQLSALRKAGVTVTAEQEQQIRSLAQAQSEVTLKSQEAAAAAKRTMQTQQESAQLAQQINQQFAGIIGGALSGFVQDLIAGEDAGKAFSNMLQRMGAQIADMAIQLLIIKPLMNSLFGGVGGGLGAGLFEGGGAVSLGGRHDGRRFSSAMWAGAPRYAKGGIVGLRPGEVPIIAHKGEIVVPNARRMAGSRSTGQAEEVNIRLHDDSGRMAEIADQRIQTASGTIIKVAVVQSNKTVQRQLPGMMANAQARNG